MNVPFLNRVIDERFLAHRLRSTSIGGLCGALVAAALLLYRYYVQHVWSWDLFAVIATIAGVKLLIMAWYFFTE